MLAERLFHADSEDRARGGAHARRRVELADRWKFALLGIDLLMQDLRLDLDRRRALIRDQRAGFGTEPASPRCSSARSATSSATSAAASVRCSRSRLITAARRPRRGRSAAARCGCGRSPTSSSHSSSRERLMVPIAGSRRASSTCTPIGSCARPRVAGSCCMISSIAATARSSRAPSRFVPRWPPECPVDHPSGASCHASRIA